MTVTRSELFQRFRNRSVLITGGLGFLGSNLAQALVREAGARVTIIDAQVPDSGANLKNLDGIEADVNLCIGSMGNASIVAPLLTGIETAFNLAGSISHLDSMRDPAADYHANCGEALSFLQTCRQHNPDITVVLSSTRQVYGRPERLPVDERHPCRPVDINGIHMLAAEQYHLLWMKVCRIPAVVLRLTNCYGPRQLIRHPRQGLTGWFVHQAVLGESIQLFGGGAQRRDFNYVDDVVEALLLAASTPKAAGRIYNLGADPPYSLRELAETLGTLAPATRWETREFPSDRKVIDIGSYWADYSLIRNELGWAPRTSLPDGLRRTLEFYQQYREWYLS